MFGPKKTPMHAKGQPRPGGAINQGGQMNAGPTSFAKPGASTGTQKKRPGGAPAGLAAAKNPAQPGLPASLAGLMGGR